MKLYDELEFLQKFDNWKKENLKVIILIFITLLFVLGVTSCSIANYATNKEYRQKQAICEHDWHEIHHYEGGGFEIYCPKCQLQKYVNNAEWNKIQIDIEYNNR